LALSAILGYAACLLMYSGYRRFYGRMRPAVEFYLKTYCVFCGSCVALGVHWLLDYSGQTIIPAMAR